ncbi:hypothetical protein GJ496_000238 [Pomphorhynchus laevis]|nr:hypothetical protein GJ496_000238 [Pomphorhynchus laevis]
MFNLYKNSFRRATDPLYIFIHWRLLNFNFKCFNNGIESEILPTEWNQDQDVFNIDYTRNGRGYTLKAINTNGTLIFSLNRQVDQRTAECAIDIKSHITDADHLDDYQSTYKNRADLIERINKELNPFLKLEESMDSSSGSGRNQMTSTTSEYQGSSTSALPRISNPRIRSMNSSPLGHIAFDYGRSDLDPYIGGPRTMGGGMVFHPINRFQRNRANFPGIRSDPVFPGNIHSFDPSPNHMPRPNFDDYI